MSYDPYEMIGRMRVLLEECYEHVPKRNAANLRIRVASALEDSKGVATPVTRDELVEKVEQVVPYVLATISPGNTFRTENSDWTKIHTGRMESSYRQLTNLLDLAQRGSKNRKSE